MLTSTTADFESDESIQNTEITHSFLAFQPLRATRSGHSPQYRHASPALLCKCRRAIHRFPILGCP
ncbi:hypothetical protein DENIT_20307 [Pseudomonas veronii]|nr:hypothetical protein DENIT_20307 [Pseudomonas veronii]